MWTSCRQEAIIIMPDRSKAVFFDRDGTLNVDTGYLHDKADFVWIEGAIEAIKRCRQAGFLVIVVTNQSGVARGYYTERDVNELHEWMNYELAQYGTRIDRFYYCPHHPVATVAAYQKNCHCRKPHTGMIDAACADFNIDRNRSWLVGDRPTDMQTAEAAGLRGILYASGSLLDLLNEHIFVSGRDTI